jgi:hypothetical protein
VLGWRRSRLGELRFAARDMCCSLGSVGNARGVCPSENRRYLSLRYGSGSHELLDRIVRLPVQMLEV